MTVTFPRGLCLLLMLSASTITADSKTQRAPFYSDHRQYDYDPAYPSPGDAEPKTGSLPIAPHYPSHGRPTTSQHYDEGHGIGHEPEPYKGPPSIHSPSPSWRTAEPDHKPTTSLFRETYEPPVYRPKPQYEEPKVPAYKPRPTYEEPTLKPRPSYEEPVHKPRQSYEEPIHKARPSYEEPAHKPRPAYEEPAYKPRPSYEEPAYKPKPAYEEPAYKPTPAYREPTHKPKPAYQEPAYKPSPAYHEPAHKPKPTYQEPSYKPSPAYREPAHKPKPAYHEPSYKPSPAYREPAHKPKSVYHEPAHKPKSYEEPHHGEHDKSYKPKNTIPGEAGVHYPVYNKIPVTTFSCDNVPYRPGMYANPDASCQLYHVCDDDRYGSRGAEFLCTNGTIFNQETFSCDWWYNVDCKKATEYYDLNLDPDHNPYYQKPQEAKEDTHGAYKPDPYKASKPRPPPSYHKPQPSYQKPRPSYHSPSPKPTYHSSPKPVYRVPTPKPYRPPTPRPVYHSTTPKPSYQQTLKPSYRPSPKPSYYVSTAKPTYRTPSPRPSYPSPSPRPSYPSSAPRPSYPSPAPTYLRSEPSYRETPKPYFHSLETSYRTPAPTYRRPVRRPSHHEPAPSYHPRQDSEPSFTFKGEEEFDFGPDFEWGARF